MKPSGKGNSRAFTPPQAMFGAYRVSDGVVLAAVEAPDPEQARVRIDAVVMLLGLPSEKELQVRKLDAFQGGVPTFYRGYFEQPIGCSALSRIGPSSRSFQ